MPGQEIMRSTVTPSYGRWTYITTNVDNNIKPESAENRIELDAQWEELRGEILGCSADVSASKSIDEFVNVSKLPGI